MLPSRGFYRGRAPRGSSARLALAAFAGLGLGGCSLSFPIASLAPRETTGAIAAAPSPLSPDLTAEDWRRARGALGVALDPQGNGSTVHWDNPDTGAKGSFVPVAKPFLKSDEVCRAFLASINLRENDTWVQASACRLGAGEWVVGDVKPWRKPS